LSVLRLKLTGCVVIATLFVTACATHYTPTPPVDPPRIPSPPVEAAPEHSHRFLPTVQTFLQKVQDYLSRLRSLTTDEPQK
jgi:hypothetical protein